MIPMNLFRRLTFAVVLATVVATLTGGCLLVPFPVFDDHGHGRGHEHHRRWSD
jgi:hypothetical protein